MLDQRGTGRSTPVGTLPGMSPAEQAEYLTHFRADAIVRDAEHIRRALDIDRWSVLGQSFGGLCVTTYLSFAPEGLREAFITGGLPVLGRPADDVYQRTWARQLERNRRYYDRYPQDRERVRDLVAPPRPRAAAAAVRRPADRRGACASSAAALGMSDGAEAVHYVLELDPDSPAFGHDVEAATPFARNPLYAIVHEACWADGGATRWAAERTMPDAFRARPHAPHRRARLPLAVRGLRRARPAARGGGDPRRPRVAAAVRPRPPRREHGPGRGGDLHGGPVRRARLLRGDGRRRSAGCARG